MLLVRCPLSVVPVRKEPSDRSELVTQWLFGETAEVLERQEKWSRLHFHLDHYEGWVDHKQMAPCEAPVATNARRTIEPASTVLLGDTKVLLPMGAVVDAGEHDPSGTVKPLSKTTADLTGPTVARAIRMAQLFIGTPYLWGGRTPWGVDCSGFTQMVYLLAGLAVPRDAWQQAGIGTTVELLDLSQPGDLAFFDNDEGRIVHVGLVMPSEGGDRSIVHASGQVRMDRLDQQGIFHSQEKRYTHKLRVVKRVV
jgi:cell wall-associated NlpC family hydrolase